MPLSCCSITCTTVSCTVCAEAPGIAGVDADLRRRDRRVLHDGQVATPTRPPASISISAITQAKTGRSMKKRESIAQPPVDRRRRAAAGCAGGHRPSLRMPGRTFCSPSTITRSPAASPAVTSHSPSTARSTCTTRSAHLVLGVRPSSPCASPRALRETPRLRHEQRLGAASLLRAARARTCRAAAGDRGSGTRARSSTEPVPWSTVTSENFSVPLVRHRCVPSSSVSRTWRVRHRFLQPSFGEVAAQAQQLARWTASRPR